MKNKILQLSLGATILMGATATFAQDCYNNGCNNYNNGYYNNNSAYGVTNVPNNYNNNYNYQIPAPVYHNYNNVNNNSCTVTTGQAVNVGYNTATVSGSVSNYSGGYNNATAYFQYGTNGNLNLSTNPIGFFGNTNLNGNLNNLACSTTYSYRAVSNINGNIQYGQILTFTTSTCQNYNHNYSNGYVAPQYHQNYVNHNVYVQPQPQIKYITKPVYVTKYVKYQAPKKRVGYKTVKYYY